MQIISFTNFQTVAHRSCTVVQPPRPVVRLVARQVARSMMRPYDWRCNWLWLSKTNL